MFIKWPELIFQTKIKVNVFFISAQLFWLNNAKKPKIYIYWTLYTTYDTLRQWYDGMTCIMAVVKYVNIAIHYLLILWIIVAVTTKPQSLSKVQPGS